jgi:hypothetical protein
VVLVVTVSLASYMSRVTSIWVPWTSL